MKKYLSFLIVFLLAVMFFVTPASAVLRHFTLTVYKATATEQLNDPLKATRLTSNVVYTVYASGVTAPSQRETLYSDNQGTAKVSNPWVSAALFAADGGGSVDFWCDPTATDDKTVEILVIDSAAGCSEWIKAQFDKHHTVVIDERRGQLSLLTIPSSSTVSTTAFISGVTKAATSIYLTIDLAPGTLIQDVFLDITAAGAGQASMDLGTGASATAYISSLDTFTAGFVQDDVFDTAFQYVTKDPAVNLQKLYLRWGTDSWDGFINILKVMR